MGLGGLGISIGPSPGRLRGAGAPLRLGGVGRSCLGEAGAGAPRRLRGIGSSWGTGTRPLGIGSRLGLPAEPGRMGPSGLGTGARPLRLGGVGSSSIVRGSTLRLVGGREPGIRDGAAGLRRGGAGGLIDLGGLLESAVAGGLLGCLGVGGVGREAEDFAIASIIFFICFWRDFSSALCEALFRPLGAIGAVADLGPRARPLIPATPRSLAALEAAVFPFIASIIFFRVGELTLSDLLWASFFPVFAGADERAYLRTALEAFFFGACTRLVAAAIPGSRSGALVRFRRAGGFRFGAGITYS